MLVDALTCRSTTTLLDFALRPHCPVVEVACPGAYQAVRRSVRTGGMRPALVALYDRSGVARGGAGVRVAGCDCRVVGYQTPAETALQPVSREY